jgi:hypothetical protein
MVLDHMPRFTLAFSIDEAALPILDRLRDTMSRDQFFRHALELGFCEIFEGMTRTHRDMTMHLLSGNTLDYKQGRATLFRTNDPDNADRAAPPDEARVQLIRGA